MVVCKFGGTSLASAECFRRVKDIVLENPNRRAVVVSAPGKRFEGDIKVTDILYNADFCAKNGGNFEREFSAAVERLNGVRVALGLETDIYGIAEGIRREYLKEMDTDYLVSRGEYLTALLMAEYLGFDFVDALGVIVFDYNGKVNVRRSGESLRAEFARSGRVVIPGFYGGYPNGGVKTFTRGGGDVSGAVVASLLSAELYENWTDVNGVRLADPRVVPNAEKVEELTYAELKRLSSLGAKILHGETADFIREGQIPIRIRNTFDLSDGGSTILPYCAMEEGKLLGIVGKRGLFNVCIRFACGEAPNLSTLLCPPSDGAACVKYALWGEGCVNLLTVADGSRARALAQGAEGLKGVIGVEIFEACVVGAVFTGGEAAFCAAEKIARGLGADCGVRWLSVQDGTALICTASTDASPLIKRLYSLLTGV